VEKLLFDLFFSSFTLFLAVKNYAMFAESTLSTTRD
jgi:hypothetical protein